MTTEEEAYRILLANPDCDIDKYQKIACQNPCLAYWIAYKIPLVDFEYCQKHACKSSLWAYWFARGISESDIEYCYGLIKSSEDCEKVKVIDFILNDL